MSGILGFAAVGAAGMLSNPARRRSRSANDEIRRNMVDQAAAAYRQGLATVSVKTPTNTTETGAPLDLLKRWAAGMATAASKQYAAQVLAEVTKASPVNNQPNTAPTLSAIGTDLSGSIGRAPLWLTIGVAVGAGYLIYKALKR